MPEQYEPVLPEGYTRIHRGAAYDDLAFRRFFERYGDREWFRRTLFVFVADHVSSEKFAPETLSYPGNCRIIGFYTPDGALRGSSDDTAQQLDIMPTVLGLTGCREPYFAFGRDVLNEPGRPVWSGLRSRIPGRDERPHPAVRRTRAERYRPCGGRTDDPDSLADRFQGAHPAILRAHRAEKLRRAPIARADLLNICRGTPHDRLQTRTARRPGRDRTLHPSARETENCDFAFANMYCWRFLR